MRSPSFIVVLFAVYSCVYAEKVKEVIISKEYANPGDEVTVICKIEDSKSPWQLTKAVWTDEKTGEPSHTEGLISDNVIMDKYRRTGRHSIESTTDGPYKLFTVTIINVNVQDNGYYMCSIDGSEDRAMAKLEVYNMPETIGFFNHTDEDVVANSVSFGEKEKKDIIYGITGVSPVPMVSVMAGEENYTNDFSEEMLKVHVPDCYPESCLLHFTYIVIRKASNFRPSVTADGKDLTCEVKLTGSNLEPEKFKLPIAMVYKPYFVCNEYQRMMIGKKNAELKCRVVSNPILKPDMVKFTFHIDEQTTELKSGESYGKDNERIEMSHAKKINQRHTEFKLKFAEVMEKHFMKYTLKATNKLGSNTTVVQMVDPDFVPAMATHTSVLSSVLFMASVLTALLFKI